MMMLPVTIKGRDYLIGGDIAGRLNQLGNVIIEKSRDTELNTPASQVAKYLTDKDQFCMQLLKEYDTEEKNIMTDSILDAIKASGALDNQAPKTKPEAVKREVQETKQETVKPEVKETKQEVQETVEAKQEAPEADVSHLLKAIQDKFDSQEESIKTLTAQNKTLDSQLKTLSAAKTGLEKDAKKLSKKNDDLTAKLKLVTPVLLDDDETYINGLDLSNDQKKAAAIFNLVTGAMTTAASGKTVDPTRFVNMVLAVSSRHAD